MISNITDILGLAVIWIYTICVIPAVLFTYMQEKSGMKIEDAPNKWLGILYHFLTVWIIMPVFIYTLIIKSKK